MNNSFGLLLPPFSPVGNAYVQCGQHVWDAVRGPSGNSGIRGRLLCLLKNGGGSHPSRTCHKPR